MEKGLIPPETVVPVKVLQRTSGFWCHRLVRMVRKRGTLTTEEYVDDIQRPEVFHDFSGVSSGRIPH
ncbi:hypothetical protein NPIL_696131 [Nephila pilipes]|uniref:Uncharacterized protein n=1 Tax=Nephila pilipes TaxID=299642 RepID=A0A8X6MKQ5_NEPPI|nr:hypothetical protein NPIL_696131 [Nephila pilipes]